MEFREKKRWGFFGLPFTFTTYMVTEELITVEEGFINKREKHRCTRGTNEIK